MISHIAPTTYQITPDSGRGYLVTSEAYVRFNFDIETRWRVVNNGGRVLFYFYDAAQLSTINHMLDENISIEVIKAYIEL